MRHCAIARNYLVNKISTTPQNKTMWIERINNANNDELSGILTDLEYYP